ncbi:DUF1499 domain-containing protein [Photobacterium sanguinicancri]|uniref:DUF1499 domain-containing protein n=1 Tax=Photobacterium sanguinicancri TaxID=875932 RepID=UPI00078952D1|nr:DUF1499 domain-containing protein [Photobacterium sanguinicancri]KXI24216.1 hypothetical protein AS132_02495 [Photobacterium sanguinicancri]
MNKHLIRLPLFSLSIMLFGCSNADSVNIANRTGLPCNDKPNCVSTIDERAEYSLDAFNLSEAGLDSWPQIEQVALALPGARLGERAERYIRVECVSSVFKFVDDFEIHQNGDMLEVRSESRTGYSDFGVNRERAETFRQQLLDAKLIAP